MGFIAKGIDVPVEVKRFFLNVKDEFQKKNDFHSNDMFQNIDTYFGSFYGIKKEFHIFVWNYQKSIYISEFAILTKDGDELNFHLYLSADELNIWLNLLNYKSI